MASDSVPLGAVWHKYPSTPTADLTDGNRVCRKWLSLGVRTFRLIRGELAWTVHENKPGRLNAYFRTASTSPKNGEVTLYLA